MSCTFRISYLDTVIDTISQCAVCYCIYYCQVQKIALSGAFSIDIDGRSYNYQQVKFVNSNFLDDEITVGYFNATRDESVSGEEEGGLIWRTFSR